VGKVVNFRQKKHENKIALKVKDSFSAIQQKGSTLTPEEYHEYIMLLIADLVVYVIRAGWYTDPGKALKNGIDAIVKRFG
jgi:hypothetical protein